MKDLGTTHILMGSPGSGKTRQGDLTHGRGRYFNVDMSFLKEIARLVKLGPVTQAMKNALRRRLIKERDDAGREKGRDTYMEMTGTAKGDDGRIFSFIASGKKVRIEFLSTQHWLVNMVRIILRHGGLEKVKNLGDTIERTRAGGTSHSKGSHKCTVEPKKYSSETRRS